MPPRSGPGTGGNPATTQVPVGHHNQQVNGNNRGGTSASPSPRAPPRRRGRRSRRHRSESPINRVPRPRRAQGASTRMPCIPGTTSPRDLVQMRQSNVQNSPVLIRSNSHHQTPGLGFFGGVMKVGNNNNTGYVPGSTGLLKWQMTNGRSTGYMCFYALNLQQHNLHNAAGLVSNGNKMAPFNFVPNANWSPVFQPVFKTGDNGKMVAVNTNRNAGSLSQQAAKIVALNQQNQVQRRPSQKEQVNLSAQLQQRKEVMRQQLQVQKQQVQLQQQAQHRKLRELQEREVKSKILNVEGQGSNNNKSGSKPLPTTPRLQGQR